MEVKCDQWSLLVQSAKMFVLGKQHWKRRMMLLLLLLQKIVTEQATKVRAVADNPQNPRDLGIKT
jgi:hypothetical protein